MQVRQKALTEAVCWLPCPKPCIRQRAVEGCLPGSLRPGNLHIKGSFVNRDPELQTLFVSMHGRMKVASCSYGLCEYTRR